MLTQQEFLRQLHRALCHLYEPDRLRQNPLAALLGVANRLDTFAALQRVLMEAIAALEPAADEPPQSPAWEVYEPLFYRYVQQLSQTQVARQLGMSVRHLRRKEHAALEVLGARLWEQFELESRLQANPQAPASPSISEELAWLRDAVPETPTDLARTLPEVLALARPLADRHGVRLEGPAAGGLPSLAVHPLALSQALLNLLTVAIRRAAGGAVSISAAAVAAGVEIEVRCAHAPARGEPVADSDAVSLDLARQLAGLCRGQLAIVQEAEAFRATLAIPALEPLTVLAIDDNADTLQLLQRYVADTRYRLITTQDPEAALDLAARFSPQVIVLDVMMPRVDGWKVLAQMREHPLTAHIPIVVCTILAQAEMALALGASGFVRKPLTRQAFLAALAEQVETPGSGRA